MARPSDQPAPPRAADPDLPPVLDDHRGLGPRSDLFGARITELSGRVEAAHSRIVECAFAPASVELLDLAGATLVDVAVEELRAVEFVARDGAWRTAQVTGGRIGTLDLRRVEIDGLTLRGMRIDYFGAASATLRDVTLIGCTIGTLDLPEARLERMRFEECRADEVDTRGLRAVDLDLRGLEALSFTDPAGLRGATLSGRQAEFHAATFARALGITVRD
jgi:hypothetical protein